MRIKLTKQVYEFLLNHILKDTNFSLGEIIIYPSEKLVYVDINNENREKIRDMAIDLQQIEGFDNKYELTQKGELLEYIIDSFYL